MRTATQISADEYLHTTYHPDVDFVDGVLEDRNLGETGHATLQGLIAFHLMQQRRTTGIHVMNGSAASNPIALSEYRISLLPTESLGGSAHPTASSMHRNSLAGRSAYEDHCSSARNTSRWVLRKSGS